MSALSYAYFGSVVTHFVCFVPVLYGLSDGCQFTHAFGDFGVKVLAKEVAEFLMFFCD